MPPTPNSVTGQPPAVAEWLAGSGLAPSALQDLVGQQPRLGLARALLALVDSDGLSDQALREQLVAAHTDARQAGAREESLVYGIYLFTHRHYQATADHLVVHLACFPGDVVAVPLLAAFSLSERADYRAHGETLVEQQYALAGEDSWPWAGWLAAVRAEQGRPQEAYDLAQHALALEPRSGPAAHARAHAEHEYGAGPAFIDAWLTANSRALQRRHLQWHAALQSLATGDFADARRRADTELRHGDVGMRSATNWRLLLAGQSPARVTEATHAHALLAAPGGWAEVFHTFQLALALAVVADADGLVRLAERAAADPRPDYAEVLAPVAHALAHITADRPGAAVDLLAPLSREIHRIGGVRVEREIIQDTLARALIDTGEPARAAQLLHHRTTHRHHHTYEDHLLRPVACGRPKQCRSSTNSRPLGRRTAPGVDKKAMSPRTPTAISEKPTTNEL
ncbi:hypothetical protein ABZY09_43645 [Streptomyces sp. NPDC002928]|uniref:hypothetical protein n=1 Tax=Streptomyces sp. NPDC002928 TaxID=3154440 RepID=UPI0033B0A7A2